MIEVGNLPTPSGENQRIADTVDALQRQCAQLFSGVTETVFPGVLECGKNVK